MSATGYTTGDPQKVDLTGDTMSGDLTLAGSATDLSVGGNLTVTGSTGMTGELTGSTTTFTTVTATTVNVSGTVTGADLVATDDLTVGGNMAIAGSSLASDLAVSGNLSVTGSAGVGGSMSGSFTGVTLDVMHTLVSNLSTGITHGGELVVNADTTKIDISAVTGYIVDYDSTQTPIGPTNPSILSISWPGVTALTPSFTPLTWYLIDNTGSLVQQGTRPTPTQRRTHLAVGATLTQDGVIIIDQSLATSPSQPINQFADLCDALGAFSITGNTITASGTNLSMNKSAGVIFARAFSQIPDYQDPHTSALPAQAPVTFRHITALVGSASALRTTLDVGNYDPSGLGVVTAVPGGANTSTNFRVYAFGNNTVSDQILIQYGQSTYSSLAVAVAAIGTGNFTPQAVTFTGALLGWISVTKSATNLSDVAQAVFTKAGKFDTP